MAGWLINNFVVYLKIKQEKLAYGLPGVFKAHSFNNFELLFFKSYHDLHFMRVSLHFERIQPFVMKIEFVARFS